MLINWFTVGAQIANFLILVWLLRRFLYKPILSAIAAREKGIADQLSDAESKRADAQKEHDDFDAKNKAFDQQRSALFQEAENDATVKRDGLMQLARNDADTERKLQAVALSAERERLAGMVTQLAKDEVIAIVRKALGDLADETLEARMEEVLIRRLGKVQGDQRELMRAAFLNASDGAVVRSTFELAAAQKSAMQTAVNMAFSADIRLRYEVSNELYCGIELTGNGQRVDWNIAAYLSSLEDGIDKLLDAQRSAAVMNARQRIDDPKAPPKAGIESKELVAVGSH